MYMRFYICIDLRLPFLVKHNITKAYGRFHLNNELVFTIRVGTLISYVIFSVELQK